MKTPKITIITATYNIVAAGRREMFMDSLRSVFEQDYKDYEHIVIDGASTDGTVELLAEYAAKGWITYISEPDTGIFNAYNKGLKMATGEYIAFLNSDDFYTRKDTFSIIVRALEESQADFTYGNVDFLNPDGTFYKRQSPQWGRFFFEIPFCHSTMFTRKKLFDELIFFDESYKIAADYDLVFKAILNGCKPICVPENFATLRLGGISSDSLSLKNENIQVICASCNISESEAKKIYEQKYLPRKLLSKLLEKATNIPDKQQILAYNTQAFLKFLKRKLFTVRFSKKRKTIRLLGITFYTNETI